MPPSFWAAYLLRLGLAALAIAALYALARRLRNLSLERTSSRCVSVVETTVLSPHATLHLLRVGRRHLLVGSGSLCVIGEVEESEVAKR